MNKQAAQHALLRMHHQPLAIAPQYCDMLASLRALEAMGDIHGAALEEHHDKLHAELLQAYGYNDYDRSGPRKPFAFAEGVAIIPIQGALINRFGSSWGFITGYNFIASQINAASADEDVELIVLDIDSPGGEVAGMTETSDLIFKSREKKPSLAVIDSSCYSAAYCLGSAATRMVVTPSGGSGSIGAMTSHVNRQKQLADNGLEVTYIFSGKHKVDGNPAEPLPDDVKAEVQKKVDTARQKFAETVARNRNMTVQAVLETEAKCYLAEDSVTVGLIDAVQTPTDAVASYYSELTGSDTPEETDDMSANASTKPGEAAANTTAAADAATAAAAIQAGIAADRQRLQAILALPEAKDRQTLATKLAFETDMPVDTVKGMLEAAGIEKPTGETAAAAAAQPGDSAFRAAMGAVATPGIVSDPASTEAAAANDLDIVATMKKAGLTD